MAVDFTADCAFAGRPARSSQAKITVPKNQCPSDQVLSDLIFMIDSTGQRYCADEHPLREPRI
jgi:hypothetical protein